jgi:hypothetical protein
MMHCPSTQRKPATRARPALGLLAAAALLLPACAADDGADPAAGADGAITSDDIVDVDDLLVVEDDGAGAIKVGEAAWLLGEARKRAREDVQAIKAALGALKVAAQSKQPSKSARLGNRTWAMWEFSKDGHNYRLHVSRLAERRLRYTLTGQAGGKGAFKTVLTGVFRQGAAKRRGGGRLHIWLDNLAAVGGPAAQGQIHLWFANHKETARGRRVVYRNVKWQGSDGPAWNYGADYIHKFGVGGRYRTVLVGDIDSKRPGVEALALRVLWGLGKGGRVDAIYGHLTPPPAKKVATMHECWDAAGLRTAYKDDVAGNDADQPDAGDVESATLCGGFAKDVPPDGAADAGAADPDPELDALLAEAEADDIGEAEAAAEEVGQ